MAEFKGTDKTWPEREKQIRESGELRMHWQSRRDIGIPELRGWEPPENYDPKAPKEAYEYRREEKSPNDVTR